MKERRTEGNGVLGHEEDVLATVLLEGGSNTRSLQAH